MLQIHGDTFDEEYLTTRFEALEVLSMTMLYNCPEPTVAVLSQKADTQHVSLHRFVVSVCSTILITETAFCCLVISFRSYCLFSSIYWPYNLV